MYPRRKKEFVQWSRAMVEGATVDKPRYPGTRNPSPKKRKSSATRRRRRKKNNAKKE